MHVVHFYTPRGPVCDPTLSCELLTIVRRTVTCPACIAALEARDGEDLRWATLRGVRGVSARPRRED